MLKTPIVSIPSLTLKLYLPTNPLAAKKYSTSQFGMHCSFSSLQFLIQRPCRPYRPRRTMLAKSIKSQHFLHSSTRSLFSQPNFRQIAETHSSEPHFLSEFSRIAKIAPSHRYFPPSNSNCHFWLHVGHFTKLTPKCIKMFKEEVHNFHQPIVGAKTVRIPLITEF